MDRERHSALRLVSVRRCGWVWLVIVIVEWKGGSSGSMQSSKGHEKQSGYISHPLSGIRALTCLSVSLIIAPVLHTGKENTLPYPFPYLFSTCH